MKPFDWKRALTFSSIGVFYIAPTVYVNYNIFLPWLVPAKAKFGGLKKVLFDQSVFASASTAGFFILINLLEGHNLKKGMNDIQNKFWTTMLVNWQIWIPAQIINFNFTPIKY